MDADICVKELDIVYMKGSKAHCDFPEVSLYIHIYNIYNGMIMLI